MHIFRTRLRERGIQEELCTMTPNTRCLRRLRGSELEFLVMISLTFDATHLWSRFLRWHFLEISPPISDEDLSLVIKGILWSEVLFCFQESVSHHIMTSCPQGGNPSASQDVNHMTSLPDSLIVSCQKTRFQVSKEWKSPHCLNHTVVPGLLTEYTAAHVSNIRQRSIKWGLLAKFSASIPISLLRNTAHKILAAVYISRCVFLSCVIAFSVRCWFWIQTHLC